MPDEPHDGAERYLPRTRSLAGLRSAAASCRGCDLYRNATQTVFGEGPRDARLMLAGEQPGDREDREGEPFVGPAGRLLDRALAEAGVRREDTYLTNVVKHFKFVPPERGKRRLHKKPDRAEVLACEPWLRAELSAVRPAVLVCLGATASQWLYGTSFRLGRHRGELLELPERLVAGPALRDCRVLVTAHPSSVLRAQEDREQRFADLVAQLRTALAAAGSAGRQDPEPGRRGAGDGRRHPGVADGRR